jgi:hypothetical protein
MRRAPPDTVWQLASRLAALARDQLGSYMYTMGPARPERRLAA